MGWGPIGGRGGEDNALCRDNAAPYSCHLPLVGETKREERGPRRLGAVRTRVSAIGSGMVPVCGVGVGGVVVGVGMGGQVP